MGFLTIFGLLLFLLLIFALRRSVSCLFSRSLALSYSILFPLTLIYVIIAVVSFGFWQSSVRSVCFYPYLSDC